MAFQSTSEELRLCFPFCCVTISEPSKLVYCIIIWDISVLVCSFGYSLILMDQITIAPLLLTFLLVLVLFPVVWDIRDPTGRFSVLKYYTILRIFEALLMTVIGITCLVMTFVFIARPSMEGELFHRYFSIGLFLYLVPTAIIHWTTIFTLKKALSIMKSTNLSIETNKQLSMTLTKLSQVQTSIIVRSATDSKIELSQYKPRPDQI